MTNEQVMQNIVGACRLIEASGRSIRDDLIALIEGDPKIDDAAKVALTVIVREMMPGDALAMSVIGDIAPAMIERVSTARWEDLGFNGDLLPTLNDIREHLLTTLITYVMTTAGKIVTETGALLADPANYTLIGDE